MSELTEEEAETIRGWLHRNQFEIVSSVGGDSAGFGDRQELWECDGTLFRLTRDRGQWWCDLSRSGANLWLDVDWVAGALGSKSTALVERVADFASIDDRKFGALSTVVPHSP